MLCVCGVVKEAKREREMDAAAAAAIAEKPTIKVAAIAEKPTIKVAAISGSLRKASFTHQLIRLATEISNESMNGMQIEYMDISELPLLNTDLEIDGKFPPVVEAFRQKILAADCYLFASPEYNYSVTGPLKTAIEWASRPPNAWAKKTAAIVSAGEGFGGVRSQYHLRQIGVGLDLHFINKPEFFLDTCPPPPKLPTDVINAETKEKLKQVLLSLQEFTLQFKNKC